MQLQYSIICKYQIQFWVLSIKYCQSQFKGVGLFNKNEIYIEVHSSIAFMTIFFLWLERNLNKISINLIFYSFNNKRRNSSIPDTDWYKQWWVCRVWESIQVSFVTLLCCIDFNTDYLGKNKFDESFALKRCV